MNIEVPISADAIIKKLQPYYEYLGMDCSAIVSDSIHKIMYHPKLRYSFYTEKILLINMCYVMLTSKKLPEFEYTLNIYKYTRNMDLGEYKIHIRDIITRVGNIIHIYEYSLIMPVINELIIYQAFIESERIIDPILKAIIMFAVSIEFV